MTPKNRTGRSDAAGLAMPARFRWNHPRLARPHQRLLGEQRRNRSLRRRRLFSAAHPESSERNRRQEEAMQLITLFSSRTPPEHLIVKCTS